MQGSRIIAGAVFMVGLVAAASAQDRPVKDGARGKLKPQPAKAQMATKTYGIGTSYAFIPASSFTPVDVPGTDDYSDMHYNDSSTWRRYGTIANAYFIASPSLPSGAKITAIYINDCVNEDASVYGDVWTCDNHGSGCTVLALIETFSGCGYDTVDLSATPFVVDNGPNGERLIIKVATTATDGSDSIAGASIEYELQVSPAPAVATFPDVPTSDLGFQYVEALVDSGVTGGCGGGLYCPDNFVTRRQMAIFIAKALGLHFQ